MPPADDDQRRLEVGDIVIKDPRVLEDDVNVLMPDFDPGGPPGAARRNADLVKAVMLPVTSFRRSASGRRPVLQPDMPHFEHRRIVVLVQDLEKYPGVALLLRDPVGPTEKD